MLSRHDLPVLKEEMERVDTLRYSWQKITAQTAGVSTELIEIQPMFKGELIEDVKTFVHDCSNFYSDYRNVSDMEQQPKHEICGPWKSRQHPLEMAFNLKWWS